MTVHRFIYKICWRNKIVLPLFLLFCVLLTFGVILQDTSFEYSPGGRLQVKYHLVHKLDVKGQSDEEAKPRHFGQHGVDTGEEVMLVWNEDHLKIGDDGIIDKSWNKERTSPGINARLGRTEDKIQTRLGEDSNVGRMGELFKSVDVNVTRSSARRISLDKLQAESINRLTSDKDGHKIKDGNKLRQRRGRRKKPRLKFKPIWSRKLYYDPNNPPEQFNVWRMYIDRFCDGQFVGYFNEFAHLKDVVVDKGFILSTRTGGEKLQDVINQPEEDEYFTYELGAFEQQCSRQPSYYFNNNNHMNDWLYSLQTSNTHLGSVDSVQHEFVIAIVRYEYVNIYHTMSDWYNAFLMMQFFNKTQWETNIVLFDAHPQGSLDSTWLVLFNTTRRLSMMPKRTLYKNMVWNILGYNSPMLDHYGPGMPLIEEFRNFILQSFDLNNKSKLNCTELNILFIWRRDYVAHPRNPTGTISRKIYNEKELMKSVQEKYPSYRIRGMQIDMFDMQKQLSTVVSTDILIGMHGAGLTHALFLPVHAAVIELVPNYWSAANDHFYAIAKWRNVTYQKWFNEDPHNEVPNGYTKIPVGVVHSLLKTTIKELCHKVTPKQYTS